MAHLRNQLKIPIKMVEMTTSLVLAAKSTKYHFIDNSTDGHILNAITMAVVVATRKKATNTKRLSKTKLP